MKRKINIIIKNENIEKIDKIAKMKKKSRSRTIEEIIEEKLRKIMPFLK